MGRPPRRPRTFPASCSIGSARWRSPTGSSPSRSTGSINGTRTSRSETSTCPGKTRIGPTRSRRINQALRGLETGPEASKETVEEGPGYEPSGATSGDAESGAASRLRAASRRVGRPRASATAGWNAQGQGPLRLSRYGFLFQTEDQEFELRVNGLLQVDARIYPQPNQNPVVSDIDIPRARIYFSGRLTKPIEYQISFQRAHNSFDILNAYLNFHYDDRLQLRVGRFKAPFTYEWYKLSIWECLTPSGRCSRSTSGRTGRSA